MHDIVKEEEGNTHSALCETEVLTSGCNGCEHLLAECFIALVLGKVEFCFLLVKTRKRVELRNLRLKHV
jgi:hypothetical protein